MSIVHNIISSEDMIFEFNERDMVIDSYVTTGNTQNIPSEIIFGMNY